MNKFQEAKSNIVNTLVRQIGFEAYIGCEINKEYFELSKKRIFE